MYLLYIFLTFPNIFLLSQVPGVMFVRITTLETHTNLVATAPHVTVAKM